MRFHSFDLYLDLMTLVLKPDLDIVILEMKFLTSVVQKLQPELIQRQTDMTTIITYPHTWMAKITQCVKQNSNWTALRKL